MDVVQGRHFFLSGKSHSRAAWGERQRGHRNLEGEAAPNSRRIPEEGLPGARELLLFQRILVTFLREWLVLVSNVYANFDLVFKIPLHLRSNPSWQFWLNPYPRTPGRELSSHGCVHWPIPPFAHSVSSGSPSLLVWPPEYSAKAVKGRVVLIIFLPL